MSEPSPPLHQLNRIARRQGWLVVLVPALAVAAAVLVVHRQHPVYRASMGIVVAQASGPYLAPLGNQPLSQTISSILTSDVIARSVVQKLNLPISSGALLRKLSVQLKPDSSVLEVSYDATSRVEALSVLRAVETQFVRVVRKTLGVSTSLNKKGPLLLLATVFDPPHLHASPVAPRSGKIVAFAAALGLALGLILAFARESLDDRIRDARDAEAWFGAPLIAALPRGFQRRAKKRAGLQSAAAENAIALLSSVVQLRYREVGPAAVLVTSAPEDDATAALVAHLGVALAASGQDVVCVDTNFRSPRLEHLLGHQENGAPSAARGLSGVLDGTIELNEALRKLDMRPSSNGATPRKGPGSLTLLPPGVSPAEPAVTLSPSRVSAVVSALSGRANYVLVDAPSLPSRAEAISFALAVDGVLVVARLGKTRRDRALQVRATLEELGARNVAVVLMDTRRSFLNRGTLRKATPFAYAGQTF